MNMMRASHALATLLAIAVLACAVLTYLWIDRSISLSYAKQGAETAGNSVQQLELLLEEEWRGMPEDQLMLKLQKVAAQMSKSKPVVKKEDGIIWFDEVRFNLAQGRLSSIGDR